MGSSPTQGSSFLKKEQGVVLLFVCYAHPLIHENTILVQELPLLWL